jgi:predicted metal-binding transcription factor (methanogenesis marker protein 9)
MQSVREKARMLDLKSGKMNKADLIRAIQSKEGNPTCFGTAMDFCDQTECCWRSDCLSQ